MKTIDYRDWARRHPIRTGICIILLAMLAVLVVAGIQNSQAQAAAGCKAVKSQTKHIESFAGSNLTNTYLKVRWCWQGGSIYEHQEKIVNQYVNCVVGWCLNWRTLSKGAGWNWANGAHSEAQAHGWFEACQDLPNINCANRERLTFQGRVWVNGATTFPEPASGGGGGGSWKN